jgi:hypothetical protein
MPGSDILAFLVTSFIVSLLVAKTATPIYCGILIIYIRPTVLITGLASFLPNPVD